MANHVFTFNNYDNGGESFSVETKVTTDGCYEQHVSLQCYGRSATLSVGDILTPQALRDLADELEAFLESNGIEDLPRRLR